MRIALFITCVNDTLFPQVGRATVELLERLGHVVVFPEQQTCCGQMHVNSGYAREALPLVSRMTRVLGSDAFDAVVAPSGSCVAMVRHQYPHLAEMAGDPILARDVAALGEQMFELSEFVVDKLGIDDVGAYFPHRVTYHPSCHGTRVLGVRDAPLRLLRSVRGIDLVALPEGESCCGFGGTFAVKNSETSAAMLTDKVRCILDTGAEVCTALDCSCLMHIGGGLSRQRTGVRPLHLAEILAATEPA